MTNKPYDLSFHDQFLEKYAPYFESVSDPESSNFIPDIGEKTIGGKIHLIDNNFIQYQAYIKKAEHTLKGQDVSHSLSEAVGEYLDSIGDTKEAMQAFYTHMFEDETKDKTEVEKNTYYRDLYSKIAGKNKAVPDKISTSEMAGFFTGFMRTVAEKGNIFNTSCINKLPTQILKVSNKERNPYGVFKMNFEDLKGTPYQQLIENWCRQGNNVCEQLRLKGAWHEMTHARGTDDEYKTEAFTYLKTLQQFKEPALLELGFFGRANAAFDRIETMRDEANKGIQTMDSNWTYQMIPMLSHLRENAPKWVKDDAFLSKSDAELMDMAKDIAKNPDLRYSKDAEKTFRDSMRGVSYENLIPTLTQKSQDQNFPTIVQDAMNFFNSYKTDDKKYQNVSEFLADKKFLLDEEHRALMPLERGQEQSKNSDKTFEINPAQQARYTCICDEIKKANPNATPLDLAKGIIVANLNDKTKIENAYNQDGTLFFDDVRCMADSKAIKSLTLDCEHAGQIVQTLMPNARVQEQVQAPAFLTGQKDYGVPVAPPNVPKQPNVGLTAALKNKGRG